MAKKKRKPDRKSPRRRNPPASRSQPPPDFAELPDRRSLEAVMRQQIAALQGQPPADTPLTRAQALLDRAFGERDEQRRVQLAREALAVCPDCADAYVLLAEHARGRKEALALYEQGVAAGERALGPEAFQQAVGHFWGILETRPYMRARLGLAHSLWVAGRRPEAVQHLREMLRLNPGDNQGVRYTLAGFLLFLDRDDDLRQLLEQYPDEGSAAWAYTRALLAFRQHGDTPEARQLLEQAKKTNKHVPAYLLGRKFPPAEPPGSYSPGAESEALEYLGSFMAGWKSTPGAIAWLRANEARARKHKAKAPQPKGPLDLVKKWLKEKLPQEEDVWQADFRPLPRWVQGDAGPVRPWVVLVASRSSDLILAQDMPEGVPSAALVWDTLVRAMQHPAAGEPHRPVEIQVRSGGVWESLRRHVEEIGVRLVAGEELDYLGGLFQDLMERFGGDAQPGLLDVPGVTPERVGSFYDAAAFFFQQAPWKQVGYEAAIRIECTRFESGPWYAVLMGQSGLTTGLALYEDLETLRRLWAGELADRENARQTVATSVTFGEAWQVPVADFDAAQRHGWKVARPDAYPEIFHKERGLSVRPPLAWELELMEGCLRAVPEFVKRRRQDDPAAETLTVPVASGELPLVLSWVVS
jgi:tetratricopeptide (TPR) repeat protein